MNAQFWFRAAAIACGFLSQCAIGATFIVNSTDDLPAANAGDGVCEASAGTGDCTLRAAVMEANTLGGAHRIELPAGTYMLTISGPGNDNAEAGDLDTGTELTVAGAGADVTRIDGNGQTRIFEVLSDRLTVEDLTLQNGRADSLEDPTGGGILAGGDLVLRRVVMKDNAANKGGAMRVFGHVLIEDSTFFGNHAEDLGFTNPWGSAIRSNNANVRILSSAFHGNETGQSAISASGGTVELLNTTVSNNTGRGLDMTNTSLLVVHATLVDNSTGNLGHFSFDGSHPATVANSITQNAHWTNCQGNFTSLGYNIAGDSSCDFAQAGDLQDADALLGSLAENGGPTPTHMPAPASPAVNRVPSAACLDLDGAALTVDQRGFLRPATGNPACDSGSVEFGGLEAIFADRFEM